ncbi:MAG TPA: beta-propeller fold lactonase family protein [Verrucomicrobiae bacterium]|jgi:YVTN family beta-propeller protein|nr:beta-propeller fold lactonase family protein [Verrucomicrobiae bacterium]
MLFMKFRVQVQLLALALATLTVPQVMAQSHPSTGPEILPTGMSITPTAARGSVSQPLNPDLPDLPQFTADHPVSMAVAPDKATLLVLTSGFNRNNDSKGKVIPAQSNEYVFVYDISHQSPVKKQVLKVPNTFVGLAWNPDGKEFYVSGGVNDSVHIFENKSGQWTETPSPVALGHTEGLGLGVHPMVAGLAVNASGKRLLAVNYENDSVSVVDLKGRKKIAEVELRPGKNNPKQHGVAGGEYPYWAVFKGDDRAYVSSIRDRELVVLDLHSTPAVIGRIKLKGQPNKLVANKAGTLLFVAEDNSDTVSIISTANDRVVATIKTTAPDSIFPNKGAFKGSNPNSLALSPDERTLYVTNGGTNSVAVISVAKDLDDSRVEGLIPTGWYPEAVTVSADGSMLYVANGKGNAGPNPKGCRNPLSSDAAPCNAANQYILQLVKGSLLTVPLPDKNELNELTAQVARNNLFSAGQSAAVADPIFAFLRTRIKHVIYVVKENRTYDQVLGDLEKGNGDPSITLFKEPVTPNHHQMARQFVTLDNFLDSGEVSGNGWNWTVAARATDNVEKTIAVNYATRGFTYDYEGENRGINLGGGSQEEREKVEPRHKKLIDGVDQLPGTADVAGPDGPEDAIGAGYLWDSALRAKLTVRNYGFFLTQASDDAPLAHDAAADKVVVAVVDNPRLQGLTDPYFRGFDQRFADYWRLKEWEREFDGYVKDGNLPNLELVRLAHDHFGNFASAIDGVNTVETEIADNDYSLGLLVEKVAHSKYASDTLIFVIEDDAQNGPDHVDAHRSIAFIVGPYVKQGAVVSQRFNTVSMLRTIEEVLGIKPLGLNDALQAPMSPVFSTTQATWSFTARVPEALRSTELPLPPKTASGPSSFAPAHDAAYWAEQTKGFDFTTEDKLDSAAFNLVLWKGIMGDKPYPYDRDGRNLRSHRRRLLKNAATN